MNPVLKVENVFKQYPSGRFKIHAVNGVSFEIAKGETLGVIGESGCGKTTLGLLLTRLIEPDAGRIFFEEKEITGLSGKNLRRLRAKIQIVFQDPFASLNPRMRAGDIIEEPLLIHRRGNARQCHEQALELLELVGLKKGDIHKYPHEFSGGQRQRIGIARAIALRPDLIIADEPVSALDVSIQGEILNLLRSIREKFNLTMLFISHDLKVISQISDRVAVMYLGKIVEMLPAGELHHAKHPYTQALLSAVPPPDPDRRREFKPLEGDVPSPIQIPSGCPFHPRCPYREALCRQTEPNLLPQGSADHIAACHFTNKVPQEIPL